MRTSTAENAVLSREELDALLEEMPRIQTSEADDPDSRAPEFADVELQRANENFAFEQGLMLSNRQQRVISFSLIGQREIEVPELAELMLPTDLVGEFQVLPKGSRAYLLLSRPFFFQLLSMSFGAGPTIKPTRPPTRDYSRIERRFYGRAAREMLDQLEAAWRSVTSLSLRWSGLVSRSSVAESEAGRAVLATFDVKGFGEPCRVRIAIPIDPFVTQAGARPRRRTAAEATGVSLLDVPIRLRAQIGTAEMTLAETARLKPGSVIELDSPSDGSLIVKIGGQEKFRAVAGTRGPKRAVQLGERIGNGETGRNHE